MSGEDRDLAGRILYQDANLIVLDKPAGLAVHGGPKTFDHVEARAASLAFGLAAPPRPVHRLDRDTAGCLVLARHDKAARRMGRLFSQGLVAKTYWAVVRGAPAGQSGRIDLNLAKVTDRQGWRIVADPSGQAASTDWRLLGRDATTSWLELDPTTGRTHQIRVHCQAGLGCPILGDPHYGDGAEGTMLHLLARRLVIPYWADRPPLVVLAEPPDHMRAALAASGWIKP